MFEENWILMTLCFYVWIKLNFNDTLPLCLKAAECYCHIAFMFEWNWILMTLCLYVWRQLNVNITLPLCLNEIEFYWHFSYMFEGNWELMTHCLNVFLMIISFNTRPVVFFVKLWEIYLWLVRRLKCSVRRVEG
jgi:hypothetical protein